MTDDLDLFTQPSGQAWARSSDPSTAHEAANDQRGSKAARLSALVLNALKILGEATSKEVSDYLGEEYVSISPRFRPLANKGVIEECGKRSKPSAIVWRIKPLTAMERAG